MPFCSLIIIIPTKVLRIHIAPTNRFVDLTRAHDPLWICLFLPFLNERGGIHKRSWSWVGFILGKSKGGLTNGGLSPKFSEKIGGKSFLENRAFSGQIGAISGLVGAFSGPIGTNSSAPHSHGGRAEIAPKGPFLARLAPFGLSPPLLSPHLDFPDYTRGENEVGQCEMRILLAVQKFEVL